MGMSLGDVYSLMVEELLAIYEAWAEREETDRRTAWEQTRFLALCALTPYSKKRLRPEDVVRFPWEEKKTRQSPAQRATAADIERIMARFGEG